MWFREMFFFFMQFLRKFIWLPPPLLVSPSGKSRGLATGWFNFALLTTVVRFITFDYGLRYVCFEMPAWDEPFPTMETDWQHTAKLKLHYAIDVIDSGNDQNDFHNPSQFWMDFSKCCERFQNFSSCFGLNFRFRQQCLHHVRNSMRKLDTKNWRKWANRITRFREF